MSFLRKVGRQGSIDRFVTRIVLGALMGLGLGLATNLGGAAVFAVSPEPIREVCKQVFWLVQWPVLRLEEIDRHRGGRLLHENPLNFLVLLAIYWMLLGEMMLPVVIWCRGYWQKRYLWDNATSWPARSDNAPKEEGRL